MYHPQLVTTLAAKAKLGTLFLNAQQAKVICLILHELVHPQPPTLVHVNNTTASGIVNNTIKQQRSQSMEMQYLWLFYQEAQQMFNIVCHPGQENLGEYPSKHHLGMVHKHVYPYYLHFDN